jgi:flagella basal body P-ring formation protein FlgA
VDAEEISGLRHGDLKPVFVGTRRSNSYATAEKRPVENCWKPHCSWVSRPSTTTSKMPRSRFPTVARRKTDGLSDATAKTRQKPRRDARGTPLAPASRKNERAGKSMNEANRTGVRPADGHARKNALRAHVRQRARAYARARDARGGARTLARAIRLSAVGILTALGLLFALLSPAFATESAPLDEAAARAIALVRALPDADGARLEVEALPFDARTNVAPCDRELASELVGKHLAGARVTVRVRCTDAANPWSVAVALRVALYRPVLVAKRALVRGDVVDADTTGLAERDVLQLGYGHLDDPARYTGSRLVRPVAEGAALAPTAVAAPLLVERGATVTLLARSSAIDVRASGVAVEDGTAGMRVRVRNVSSGRVVDGVVDGPGVVLIRP